MAYESKNLSVLSYANGFTLWHYTAPLDAPVNIAAVNYFEEAAGFLRVGDRIIISALTEPTEDSGDNPSTFDAVVTSVENKNSVIIGQLDKFPA